MATAAISGGAQLAAALANILGQGNNMQWLHGAQGTALGRSNNAFIPEGEAWNMLLNSWNPNSQVYNNLINRTGASIWGPNGNDGAASQYQDLLNSIISGTPGLWDQFVNNPSFQQYRDTGQYNYNRLDPQASTAQNRFTQGSPSWEDARTRTQDWYNGLDPALASMLNAGTGILDYGGGTAWNGNVIDTMGSLVSQHGYNNPTQGIYDRAGSLFDTRDPSMQALMDYLQGDMGRQTPELQQLLQGSQGLLNNSGFSSQGNSLFQTAMGGANTGYDQTAQNAINTAQGAANSGGWNTQLNSLLGNAQGMFNSTPQMNTGFGQGSDLFKTGGYTPQMGQFQSSALSLLNPQTGPTQDYFSNMNSWLPQQNQGEMNQFLQSTLKGVQDQGNIDMFDPVVGAYQEAINSGGGTANSAKLWESINSLASGGGGFAGSAPSVSAGTASFSPVSMLGHGMGNEMAEGWKAFQEGKPLSQAQTLSLTRDQAATASAQQAQAALARAAARGGGAGSIGSGVGNSAMADFASSAAENEASALRDSLFKNQDLRMQYGVAGGQLADSMAKTNASYASGLNSANASLAASNAGNATSAGIANANLQDSALNRALQARLGGVNAGVNLQGTENERFLGSGSQLQGMANAETNRLGTNAESFLGGVGQNNQFQLGRGQLALGREELQNNANQQALTARLGAGTDLANSLISGGSNNLATAAGLMGSMVDAGNTRAGVGATLGSSLAGTSAQNFNTAMGAIPGVMNANTNRFGTAMEQANAANQTAAGREATGLQGLASGVTGANTRYGTNISGLLGANETDQNRSQIGLQGLLGAGGLANTNLNSALTGGNAASQDQINRMGLASNLLQQNVAGRQGAMNLFNTTQGNYDNSQLGFGNLGLNYGQLFNSINNSNVANEIGLGQYGAGQAGARQNLDLGNLGQLGQFIQMMQQMQGIGLTGNQDMTQAMLQYLTQAGPGLTGVLLGGSASQGTQETAGGTTGYGQLGQLLGSINFGRPSTSPSPSFTPTVGTSATGSYPLGRP